MDDRTRTRLSKFLSLALRHRPEVLGIELDAQGWTDVETLLSAAGERNRPISRTDLEEVVARCDKQRFAFSEDGSRIRASQGHSKPVELDYEPQTPPELLFHGTAKHRLAAIRVEGLRRMQRHHVHLSPDRDTARRVGARHGEVVVLTVRAGELHRQGQVFFRSANGVWLTDHVPPDHLDGPAP